MDYSRVSRFFHNVTSGVRVSATHTCRRGSLRPHRGGPRDEDVEIKHIRHILQSGAYAFVIFVLVFFQPDFGSAIIVIAIWFGMVLVAGLSWKHLSTLCIVGAMLGAGLWNYGLQEYQQERILTFLHPLADIQGAGYNAYQSTVAVGSGELIGKGIGYGT